MQLIFKILQLEEWIEFSRDKIFAGSAIDKIDGFIHLSPLEEVKATVESYFSDSRHLILVAVRVSDAVKWESSRGGILFPHLYRSLTLKDIQWVRQYA